MTSDSTSGPDLSLIVPTYNEADNIPSLLERVNRALSGYDYEVIVVDDNSPDGTAEIARKLSAQYPVRVVVRTAERGLASAVVAGFREARGRLLGVIDADLQHPPEMLPDMVKTAADGADVVIASRYVPGGGTEDWNLWREVMSRGAKLPASLLFPSLSGIRDPLSGFFLFRSELIDGVTLSPIGYKILLEVLIRTNARSVVEVPFTFRGREHGQSNLTLGEQINYLVHLARLAWISGQVKRFIKYSMVGASGTLVYFGLLTLLTEVVGIHYLISAAIGYEVSILTNFTLNELWTFGDKRKTARGSIPIRAVKFNLVSLVGWGIHEAILAFFTEVAGLFYIFSAILAIATAMLWNFFVNVHWTWQEREL